jgi:hypothetical protein
LPNDNGSMTKYSLSFRHHRRVSHTQKGRGSAPRPALQCLLRTQACHDAIVFILGLQ